MPTLPPPKTDVIIVGAGPTGLMAANQLARFGVNFLIVDRKPGPTTESRAIVVTARSLEIYQQMGLDEQVLKGGKKITSFKVYSDGKRKAEVNVGEIGKGLSQFSYMMAFEQSKNEELLNQALIQMGCEVFWNTEFTRLTEYKERIVAEISIGETAHTVEAKYLLACDGANSAVRQQLNFSFGGGTYDHKFFVADTHLQWSHDYHQLIIAPGDDNFCAFLPLYGDDSYRVLGTLPKTFVDKENITFQDLDQIIRKTIAIPLRFTAVNWFSVYRLHHRCVNHLREGCVFLAGDSAHIHSPAGGQGMNTGLQDAYNLCWKLALVLKGKAKESLLQTYDEERLPFAQWLLQFTDRGFSLMTNSNPVVSWLRKNVGLTFMGLVVRGTLFRRRAFKILSQIWYSYKGRSLSRHLSRQPLQFRAGDRIPYLGTNNVHLKLRGAGFHLLHLGNNLNQEQLDEIVKWFPFPVTIINCDLTNEWRHLGVLKELFLLIRPDNYLAMITDSIDEGIVQKYLKGHFA